MITSLQEIIGTYFVLENANTEELESFKVVHVNENDYKAMGVLVEPGPRSQAVYGEGVHFYETGLDMRTFHNSVGEAVQHNKIKQQFKRAKNSDDKNAVTEFLEQLERRIM